MSDGREGVHKDVEKFAGRVEGDIAGALEDTGHEVVRAREVVWTNRLAVREARRVAAARPGPDYLQHPGLGVPALLDAGRQRDAGAAPALLQHQPATPGMVGMLAAAGGLDQIGRTYGRAWGDVSEPAVLSRLETYARAASAVRSLEGSTFGRIGGRPMGMYTAVSNTDQWMEKFGVDVEEIDQWELVRRSAEVEGSKVRAAREWLEAHAAGCTTTGTSSRQRFWSARSGPTT